MMYADFEIILMLDDSRKQNPNGFYASKYAKHVAYSYGYKLVFVNEKNKLVILRRRYCLQSY